MPNATPKYSKPEVRRRIHHVFNTDIVPHANPVADHSPFNGLPALRITVLGVAKHYREFQSAVRDSSGISPKLSNKEILDFNPANVGELVSLVYDRLSNRDRAFVAEKVMTEIRNLGGAGMKEEDKFRDRQWEQSHVKIVVKLIRASLSRYIRFDQKDSSKKKMYRAENGKALIKIITDDFEKQRRRV